MRTEAHKAALAKNIQFLLVEDNDIDAEVVERTLARTLKTWSLTRAHNGEEALEMMLGSRSRPALDPPYSLLLDLSMPRMDGLELLQMLNKAPVLPESPIFVMTSSTQSSDILSAYQYPICDYIEKPLHESTLEHIVLASAIHHERYLENLEQWSDAQCFDEAA